jgi:outer membrane protein assembly factor BamB
LVVAASGRFNSASLIALKESDGTIAWRHDYGETFAVNHPAVWGGRIFAATSGHEATAMWSFDLADGSVESRVNFASQWEHYLAPTIKDGHVFTNGGMYGGMYSFRGLDGTQRWFANLQQYDLWTPAVDNQYAYSHTGYEFAITDRRNGTRVATIPNSTFNWHGYSLNTAPVLGGDGSVLVVDGIYSSPTANNLIRYDIATRTESWRIGGSFVSNPVVAGGRVYVLNSTANRLEARDLTTGALAWSWVVANAQESLPVGNMIVTDNLIFLNTTTTTYAIDLNTKAAVWQRPLVGHMAMTSNKVLVIVGEQKIDAFDLE